MSATLRDVAREARVSLSAASYALRGSSKVAVATAERVRSVARRIGYRENPRISELMAHMRGGRSGAPGERLALVWCSRTGARGHLRSEVARGARMQARRRGYGLEEFVLGEDALPADRLATVLRARGITGILLGPLQSGVRGEADLPWDRFASAVIGAADWPVPLSRAAHHHFEAMRRALMHAATPGARIACWLDPVTDERGHRGWRGAWMAHAPEPDRTRLLLRSGDIAQAEVGRWLASEHPTVLITNAGGQAARALASGWRGIVLLLDRRRGDGHAGVRQGYGSIASQAADLVITQLQSRDFGSPRHPRTLLFPGTWEKSPGRSGPGS